MTESDGTPDPGSAAPEPTYADRAYRSVPGVISGVLLLAVAVFLIVDALVHGSGRTPWVALALAPLIGGPLVAFTLRPVVYANDRRVLVRNPLRTIDAPWSTVEAVRAGYSVELLAGGKKYQLWAVPVSLRQRKRAGVHAARAAAEQAKAEAEGRSAAATRPRATYPGQSDPTRAWSDQVADTLRDLAERNAGKPEAAGSVVVSWCWWVIAPTLAGLLALVGVIASG